MIKQFHLFIKGDVIGVGFRAWTKIQARIVGITGWVRNINDGVEAVIQGEEEKVNQMIRLLKHGPPVSRVDQVKVSKETIKQTFDDFEIKM